MVQIEHNDGTKLAAYETQTCVECEQTYELYNLYVSYDQGYYEAAYVECPHCENETVIYTYWAN